MINNYNPNIIDLQSNISVNALPQINEIINLSDCVPLQYSSIKLHFVPKDPPANSSIKSTKKLPSHNHLAFKSDEEFEEIPITTNIIKNSKSCVSIANKSNQRNPNFNMATLSGNLNGIPEELRNFVLQKNILIHLKSKQISKELCRKPLNAYPCYYNSDILTNSNYTGSHSLAYSALAKHNNNNINNNAVNHIDVPLIDLNKFLSTKKSSTHENNRNQGSTENPCNLLNINMDGKIVQIYGIPISFSRLTSTSNL